MFCLISLTPFLKFKKSSHLSWEASMEGVEEGKVTGSITLNKLLGLEWCAKINLEKNEICALTVNFSWLLSRSDEMHASLSFSIFFYFSCSLFSLLKCGYLVRVAVLCFLFFFVGGDDAQGRLTGAPVSKSGLKAVKEAQLWKLASWVGVQNPGHGLVCCG